MAEDEEEGQKPHKASIEDEFLRHPHSGAYIRNPFLEHQGGGPILFQAREFEFNCLDEALRDYHFVSVSESSFRAMTSGARTKDVETTLRPADIFATTAPAAVAAPATSAATGAVPLPSTPRRTDGTIVKTQGMNTLSRAALGKLRDLPGGFTFILSLKKSAYVPPRNTRRRQAETRTIGTMIDKLNIDVSDIGGRYLRVESLSEGLVTMWNRANPALQVRQGDTFVKVNTVRGNAAAILEELNAAPDALRITVRRPPADGRASRHDRQDVDPT